MEAQHQVSLLVNETRQLSGVREQAVMPAWTANTLDANLVEFRSVKVDYPAVHVEGDHQRTASSCGMHG